MRHQALGHPIERTVAARSIAGSITGSGARGATRSAAGQSRDVIRQPRHRESRVSTDIDAIERLEIESDVQCQSVIARTAANSETDARELGAPDVHPRRL